MIKFLPVDFPNGFDAELLRQQLVTNHGKAFNLATSSTDVILQPDPVDDSIAITATCRAHFAMTKADRDIAILDAQTTDTLQNGDKFRRFLFTVLYDQESRLRVLEAKLPITKLQYLNGLRNAFKNA